MAYYQQKKYTGKRVANTISNLLWRLVMTVLVLIIVAVCAYGCNKWLHVMGTEVG